MLKLDGFAGKFGNTVSSAAGEVTVSAASVRTITREEEKIKPPSSFKLKKAFAETVQHYDASGPQNEPGMPEVKVEARTPFDAEKVRQALDTYIRSHKPETTVAIALRTHTPVVDEENIVLEVDNCLQQEKLDAVRGILQTALIKHLNNGALTLSVRIFDDTAGKQEERRLITSQDKLEHFIKQNPVVAEMAKMFGLEFE